MRRMYELFNFGRSEEPLHYGDQGLLAMHRFHLLLVDDHENIRFTFRLALETEGYDVDLAASLSEAQAKIEARCYDVLILDLRLGVESGLTLLAQMRADRIDTPVIMITAHGSAQEAVAAMKLGAVDFLAKPLHPVQLRSAVAEVLRRRLPASDMARTPPAAGPASVKISEARHALNCRDVSAARLHLARALELNSHSADAHYLYGCMLEMSQPPGESQTLLSPGAATLRGTKFRPRHPSRLPSVPMPGPPIEPTAP